MKILARSGHSTRWFTCLRTLRRPGPVPIAAFFIRVIPCNCCYTTLANEGQKIGARLKTRWRNQFVRGLLLRILRALGYTRYAIPLRSPTIHGFSLGRSSCNRPLASSNLPRYRNTLSKRRVMPGINGFMFYPKKLD